MRQRQLGRRPILSTILSSFLALGLAMAYPAGATTVLRLDSDPGDYIGGGRQVVRTSADGAFVASSSAGEVRITFNGGADFWDLDFAAPAGGLLAPGAYEAAQRWPFQSPTHPGLSVDGDGAGCNQLVGRFVVREIALDAQGNVISFAADFEQHCELATPALFGTILFHTGDSSCAGAVDGTSCDDADPCTGSDACHAGICSGASTCGAGTSCSAPACTPRTGGCIPFDRVDGTACDDGEPMTSVDTCQNGRCAGFPPVTTTTLCPAPSTTSSTTTTTTTTITTATTTTTLPMAACAVDRSDEAAALSSLVLHLQNRLASIENHARRRAHRQRISAECSDALSEILSNAGSALGEVSPSK